MPVYAPRSWLHQQAVGSPDGANGKIVALCNGQALSGIKLQHFDSRYGFGIRLGAQVQPRSLRLECAHTEQHHRRSH